MVMVVIVIYFTARKKTTYHLEARGFDGSGFDVRMRINHFDVGNKIFLCGISPIILRSRVRCMRKSIWLFMRRQTPLSRSRFIFFVRNISNGICETL